MVYRTSHRGAPPPEARLSAVRRVSSGPVTARNTALGALVLGALAAYGCAANDDPGGTLAPRDAGVPRDTGSVRDTGATLDRGAPPVDTGIAPPMDTGPTPPLDTGVVVRDAGNSGMDAGFPAVDAGRDAAVLGDVFQEERDAGDPTPRNVDLTANGAGTDSAGRFNGTDDPSRAPTIVYPSEGTILPPNLTGFEVHFRPAAGQDLFEVSLRGDRGLVRVFTTCAAVGGGCALSLNEQAYNEFARVAWPSGNVAITVRGVTRTGGNLGRSATRNVQVTNTDVRGGLYYWNASSGSILRFEFGRAGARPEPYLRGDPINCLGCHVLSRDGTRAAVGRFIPGPAQTRVYDVATRRETSGNVPSNFATFSPDSSRVILSDGARMWLRDGTTAAFVPGLAEGTPGSMPDWSRDGRTVVFARPRGLALFGQPGHGAPADLLTMTWNGTAFAAPQPFVMAAGMQNHYYPAISPDDRWVMFNRSASESYHNIASQLWAAPLDRTRAPVRMAAADGEGNLGNSWPKWAPFVQTFRGQPLLWVTFSSRRDYGLRLQQQSREVEMRTSQLWMAAFRPGATGDPSAPAFWLPFQDIRQGNHIAQWSEQVQRRQCRTDTDCTNGERCLPVGFSTQTLGCVAP